MDERDEDRTGAADDLFQRTADLARWLVERDRLSPVTPPPSPEQLRAELDLSLPAEPRQEGEWFDALREVVERTPSTSSHRFYNQLFAGRIPAATVAEALTALLNSSMYTYKAAGVHTLIERRVIARLCELVGYRSGGGTFAPGGSMANLVALIVARNEAFPRVRDEGGAAAAGAVVYVSDQGHYSIRKNAGMLGIGRANVRAVRSDHEGRMIPSALSEAIAADREAGRTPLCVVATAGTTVMGAFDPIDEIATLCERERIWLHVDAAFGGSFLLHPELRQRLRGVERSNSVAWCAHKMMGVPMPCSAILVRYAERSSSCSGASPGGEDPNLLRRHFNEAADYLFQQDEADLNLGHESLQCGRRNDAFKLWAAWQALGDRGWRERLERQRHLALTAVARIEREPALELLHRPESLCVCFTVSGVASDELCAELSRRGLESVGYGLVRGAKAVRLVTSNPEVTEGEIERFFDDLLAVADDLRRRGGAAAATTESVAATRE